MAFFKDITTEIDSNIRNTYYPGLDSEADGIDLRIEMNRILYRSEFKKPLGHWVVVRNFNHESQSKYFNKYSKEGVGGPAHEFIDMIVRTRQVPISQKSSGFDPLKPFSLINDGFMYYFEWFIELHTGTQIFEIDERDNATKPITYTVANRFEIAKAIPFRLENGNIQFWTATTFSDNIIY